jgi:hypothetical protein
MGAATAAKAPAREVSALVTAADIGFATLVREGVSRCHASGVTPVVALDLDLTLIDNTARTRRILTEYITTRPMSEADRTVALHRATSDPIAFSILTNWANLGLDDAEARGPALAFWRARFFAGDYCRFDVPYPHAARACAVLHGVGAQVVYLTARLAPEQGVETVRFLQHHGFPVCEAGTHLWMKAKATESDDDYKKRACADLARLGQVVAAVDNEPGHCNALATAFPQAHVALFASRHSPGAPPVAPGVLALASWEPFSRRPSQENEA